MTKKNKSSFRDEILKRTGEIKILNWSVLVLSFWLITSIILVIHIKYKEHACNFSHSGKCYPVGLECKKKSGVNAFKGNTISHSASSESLTVNPSASCVNETIIFDYPNTSTGTSKLTVDLLFDGTQLTSGSSILYKDYDYTSTQNVRYSSIFDSNGVSVGVSFDLSYFAGTSPWFGTSSVTYPPVIRDVILKGLSEAADNIVITSVKPLKEITTNLETGIIVLKDVNQDSFNTINFSKNSHSPGLAEKVPLIKSDKIGKNDQTLFTIKEIPSKNLDPDDFKNSYDPYYNFYQTNKYLINVGCKNLNENFGTYDSSNQGPSICPCVEPGLKNLPSHTTYPKHFGKVVTTAGTSYYNRFCTSDVTDTTISTYWLDPSKCVPFVDFSNTNQSPTSSFLKNVGGDGSIIDKTKDIYSR